LAACGSSNGHAGATSTAVVSSASPRATTSFHAGVKAAALAAGSSAPLTKAQARAFAGAVDLTAADVPGFKVGSGHEHEQETATEKRLEHEMLACVHASSSKELVEVSSNEFERKSAAGDLGVQSEVSVARTSSLAAKELAVIRSGHSRACLSHYLDLLLKGEKYQGASFAPVSIVQSTPPAAGTTGSFAWRITLTIILHGIRLSTYMDILGFVYGPAQVALFATGLPHPFSAAGEQQLFSLLLQRAKAQGLCGGQCVGGGK